MSLGVDPRKLDYFRELPQNWKQKIQLLLMKNAVFFFHALDGTDVFLGVAETPQMVVKSRPQKYAERC